MIYKKIIYLIFFIGLVAAGAAIYYYRHAPRPDYTVLTAPYYGFYNHFYSNNPSAFNAALMVLGYWDDERFSEEEIWRYITSPYPFRLDLHKLRSFFERAGYHSKVEIWEDSGLAMRDLLAQIEKGRPAIVYQKVLPETSSNLLGFRLVVGVSKNEVVVHDYFYGPYHRISYRDFEAMIQSNKSGMLAVWKNYEPGTIENTFERKNEMVEIGERMAKITEILMAHAVGDIVVKDAISALRSIYADETFAKLPPAYRVSYYDHLANLLLIQGRNDEAVEFISGTIIPLNKDLDQPSGYWSGHVAAFLEWVPGLMTTNKLSRPYVLLGLANVNMGRYASARENFYKALTIHPDHPEALAALRFLNNEEDKKIIGELIQRIPEGRRRKADLFGSYTL